MSRLPSSRLSSFLALAMLRSVHSWTSWRRAWTRRRRERRLLRVTRRLDWLDSLTQELQAQAELLEQRLYPPLATVPSEPLAQVLPFPEPEPEWLQEELLLAQTRPEPTPEELEPMPDPVLEVSRLIGLPTPPS